MYNDPKNVATNNITSTSINSSTIVETNYLILEQKNKKDNNYIKVVKCYVWLII